MCRHMYDWNIVNCDVKQPIQQSTTSEIEETGHKLANNCIRYIDTSFTVQKHILCHHDILNKTFWQYWSLLMPWRGVGQFDGSFGIHKMLGIVNTKIRTQDQYIVKMYKLTYRMARHPCCIGWHAPLPARVPHSRRRKLSPATPPPGHTSPLLLHNSPPPPPLCKCRTRGWRRPRLWLQRRSKWRALLVQFGLPFCLVFGFGTAFTLVYLWLVDSTSQTVRIRSIRSRIVMKDVAVDPLTTPHYKIPFYTLTKKGRSYLHIRDPEERPVILISAFYFRFDQAPVE